MMDRRRGKEVDYRREGMFVGLGIGRALKRWAMLRPQRAYLARLPERSSRAIVFFVPGNDAVNGGVLSISSLAEVTQTMRDIHGADVFVCPFPGDPNLLRFTQFENPHTLMEFSLLRRSQLKPGCELLLHVPEMYMGRADRLQALRLEEAGFRTRLNILLQNVDFLPSRQDVDRLWTIGPVTATTAHKAYANEKTAQALGCPVQHLSVWVCPERFDRIGEDRKERLIMVSPDANSRREEVLARLRGQLADYRFQVVGNLKYAEYRALAGRARFSLTFGEGLDGYFVETIFSGGIGCAVFNDRFFTARYRDLPCVYASWDDVIDRLAAEVRQLEAPEAYGAAQASQFAVAASDYQYDEYLSNLRRFYAMTFQAPRPGSVAGVSPA